MKIAIMQPYFLPYIGYYQLISSVDEFIIYDNIKYTKKGWINRNRFLLNNKDEIFSLPLKNDSDTLNVVQREISKNFDRNKLINKFNNAYKNAPYFKEVMPVVSCIIKYDNNNLFDYIFNSVKKICIYLEINTKIKKSSDIDIDHNLKAQEKIIAFCKKLEAKTYINPIGGLDIYSSEFFKKNGIDLYFLRSDQLFKYDQYQSHFVPWLSIIDVLMFNSLKDIKNNIHYGYDLLN